MRRQHGFTIIELLVVISIIALLIAMLMPALSAARTSARQAICAANLQQLGVANISYAADNDQFVMKMNERGTIYPFDIAKQENASGQLNVWSIEGIQPYIASFKGPSVAIEGAGIAVCPEVDRKLMDKFYRIRNKNHWFIEIQYGYFGGVDRVRHTGHVNNGAEDYVVESTISTGDRVWMTDILYRDISDNGTKTGAWRYNHGTRGWAFNEYDWMPNETSAVPLITGMNRLMGDGAVNWKAANEFKNINLMNKNSYPEPSIGRGDVAYF